MKQKSSTNQQNEEDRRTNHSIHTGQEKETRKGSAEENDRKLNIHDVRNRARKGYHNDGPGGGYTGF